MIALVTSSRTLIAWAAMTLMVISTVRMWHALRILSWVRRIICMLYPVSLLTSLGYAFATAERYQFGWGYHVVLTACAIICALVTTPLFRMLLTADQREIQREKARLLKKQVDAQRAYLESLKEANAGASDLLANTTNMLEAFEKHLKNGETEQAAALISRGPKAAATPDTIRFHSDPAVDAVLCAKARTCAEKGFNLQVSIDVIDFSPLKEEEVCALLFNLVDDALGSCRDLAIAQIPKQETGYVPPSIFVHLYTRADSLVLEVLVSASAKRAKLTEAEKLSSAEQHFCLVLVRAIAKRHEGNYACVQQGNTSKYSVVIPLRENLEEE